MYRPIQDVLAFVYVLCEFALVGKFDEDLITFPIGGSKKREQKNNTGCISKFTGGQKLGCGAPHFYLFLPQPKVPRPNPLRE
jgi:hypothetical protein